MQSLPHLAHGKKSRSLTVAVRIRVSTFRRFDVSTFSFRFLTVAVLFGCAALAPQASYGATPLQSELWQRAIDDVSKGKFQRAAETLSKVRSNDELATQVRTWLAEFEAKQAARRELDQADFDKYVGYAKARVERKEYPRALGWALWALNTTADREEFLAGPWLLELVNASLAKADELRQEDDWRGVWGIYSQLASLYEREPRYQKLERQALTHLRLENMFGEKSKWRERIEKVRWRDAQRALEEIDRAYVEPADFRDIAESGLEQMLLLADSKTAQEKFPGLADEDSRDRFKLRVQARLDQVRAATEVGRVDCVKHFRRVVKSINKETAALPEELVVSELMRGSLDVLDDYTTIIWPSASTEFDKHTRGDFVGVGISISKNRADEIEVITPMDGGPAYAAGIQAGDVITHVDGESLKDFSINKVVKTITGENGTPVTLTIRRGEESLDFDLIRRKVHIVSVRGHQRNSVDEERWDYWLDRKRGIGYIRLTNFARNTFEDLQNALSELPHLQGLILDLRGNPGGLLDSAWNVTSLFLERGDVVVSTKGRISSEDNTLHANSTGDYAGFPLIVLVDTRSASASEIVSGAIRDNGRGTVVGERTFGKFSVQNLVQLSRHRSGAKLKITTARYYLPNGDSLHRAPMSETWGVAPAISVPLVNKERVKIWQAQRKANLLGPPKATPKTADADEQDKDESDENAVEQDGDKKPADKDAKEAPAEAGDADPHAAEDKDKKDELPPLEQPDENNRPEADPTLDTALLLLRVALLGEQFPTLTVAEAPTQKDTAKP